MINPEKTGKNEKRTAAAAAVLFSVFIILVLIVTGRHLYRRGFFLPRWITWNTRKETILTYEPHPLYPDPYFKPVVTGEARLVLEKRRVQIYEADASSSETAASADSTADADKDSRSDVPVYTTPAEWLVSDVLLSDLNQDGIEEILLLVWKRGAFGGVMPFWQDRDSTAFSQHLYIFNYQEEKLDPLWMASEMPQDVSSVEIAPPAAAPDGTPGTIPRVRLLSPDGNETFWIWDRWGLKLSEGQL